MSENMMLGRLKVQRVASYVVDGNTRFVLSGYNAVGEMAQWVLRADQIREEADRAALALAMQAGHPFNVETSRPASGTFGVVVEYPSKVGMG